MVEAKSEKTLERQVVERLSNDIKNGVSIDELTIRSKDKNISGYRQEEGKIAIVFSNNVVFLIDENGDITENVSLRSIKTDVNILKCENNSSIESIINERIKEIVDSVRKKGVVSLLEFFRDKDSEALKSIDIENIFNLKSLPDNIKNINNGFIVKFITQLYEKIKELIPLSKESTEDISISDGHLQLFPESLKMIIDDLSSKNLSSLEDFPIKILKNKILMNYDEKFDIKEITIPVDVNGKTETLVIENNNEPLTEDDYFNIEEKLKLFFPDELKKTIEELEDKIVLSGMPGGVAKKDMEIRYSKNYSIVTMTIPIKINNQGYKIFLVGNKYSKLLSDLDNKISQVAEFIGKR